LYITEHQRNITLFPYTTLFRSVRRKRRREIVDDRSVRMHPARRAQRRPRRVADRVRVPVEVSLADPRHGTPEVVAELGVPRHASDRKSTRLNSSHVKISYDVFC